MAVLEDVKRFDAQFQGFKEDRHEIRHLVTWVALEANSWSGAISYGGASVSARFGVTAAWSGSEDGFYIFGGTASSYSTLEGLGVDPTDRGFLLLGGSRGAVWFAGVVRLGRQKRPTV